MAELFSGKEKKEMQKAIKKYFPVFVLPTMIAFTIGFIAPFLLGIYLSFCKFTTVTDAEFIGLGNYIKTLGDAEFIHSLWYTALYTVVTVLLINVLAFAVAMLLTKGIKGTNIFRTVFFMPNLIGGIVLGYVWQLLLNGILANFDRTLTYSEVFRHPEYTGRTDRSSKDRWSKFMADFEKRDHTDGHALNYDLYLPDTDERI